MVILDLKDIVTNVCRRKSRSPHVPGTRHPGMALASVLETLLVVAAAATIVMAYGVFADQTVFTLVPETALMSGTVVCLLAPWLLVGTAPRIPGLGRLISRSDARRILRGPLLPSAFLIYLGFFAGTGVIAWWTLEALAVSPDMASLPVVAAGFIASWLVGYMTPGASGSSPTMKRFI